MQISLPGPDFEWKGVLLRLALGLWLSKSWNNVSSCSRDFFISSFMNDISSLVGSFWTASLTRVNTSVVAESSLFLDNCLLFVFIRTNSSFSLTLSSDLISSAIKEVESKRKSFESTQITKESFLASLPDDSFYYLKAISGNGEKFKVHFLTEDITKENLEQWISEYEVINSISVKWWCTCARTYGFFHGFR